MIIKGKINIELQFPIIAILKDEYSVCLTVAEYTVCKKDYISTLQSLPEFIIDSEGIYYQRDKMSFLNYINLFKGFSLKYASTGVCYSEKRLIKIGELSETELSMNFIKYLARLKKSFSGTPEEFQRINERFENAKSRHERIRLLFYIIDPVKCPFQV